MANYSNALQNIATNQGLLKQLQAQGALPSAQAQLHTAMAQQAAARQMWVSQNGGLLTTPDVPTPPPRLPTSTQFGEITGYRFWNYHRGFLKSASQEYIWMPGKVAGLQEGQTLDDYGAAGIHAFKSQSDMVLQSYRGDLVFGTVKLWGDVIEYESGYHAEFASITSLDHIDLPDDRSFQGEALYELRQRYNLKTEQ